MLLPRDKHVRSAVAVIAAAAVFLIVHGTLSRPHWEQRKRASEARIQLALNTRAASVPSDVGLSQRWMKHAILDPPSVRRVDHRSWPILPGVWMTVPDGVATPHARSILALLLGMMILRSALPRLWHRWWLASTGLTRTAAHTAWLRELGPTLRARSDRSLCLASVFAAVGAWYLDAVRPTETGGLWAERWLAVGPGTAALSLVWIAAWMSVSLCRTLSDAAESRAARTMPAQAHDCVRCAYPLTGLGVPVCPECGLPARHVNPVRVLARRLRAATPIALAAAAMVAVGAFLCSAYAYDRSLSAQSHVLATQLGDWYRWSRLTPW